MDGIGSCPQWCVEHRMPDEQLTWHLGVVARLAAPEVGNGVHTARLARRGAGGPDFVLVERAESTRQGYLVSVDAIDLLLDGLDDDGQAAMQRLGGLVATAAGERRRRF